VVKTNASAADSRIVNIVVALEWNIPIHAISRITHWADDAISRISRWAAADYRMHTTLYVERIAGATVEVIGPSVVKIRPKLIHPIAKRPGIRRRPQAPRIS